MGLAGHPGERSQGQADCLPSPARRPGAPKTASLPGLTAGRRNMLVSCFPIVEQEEQARRYETRPSAGRENAMRSGMTRRSAIKTAALATTALIAAPYIRGAHAAGKLSIGFWDHWVPGANKTSEALVKEWAEKEKVEVQIDYIPSQGDKNLITIAAEGQARSRHDIFAFPTWYPHAYSKQLVPLDDIMEPLIKQNGAVNDTVQYLGKVDGK